MSIDREAPYRELTALLANDGVEAEEIEQTLAGVARFASLEPVAPTSAETESLIADLRQHLPQRPDARASASALRPRAKIIWASAVAAVIAVALLFGFELIDGSSIGPAAAQAEGILRSAAALRLGPNEVAHYVYRVSISGGTVKQPVSGTTSVWFGASGDTPRSAQDITLAKGGSAVVPLLLSRYVQIGGQLYGYDASHNTILPPYATGTASPVVPSAAFGTASAAQSLQATLAQDGARLVGVSHETLDGHQVDAITVDGAFGWPSGRGTFYFDSRTHALRGFDVRTINPSYPAPSWTVRLVSSEDVPAASAPTGTFKLGAPADALVQAPAPDKQALLRLLSGGAQKPGMSILEAVQAAHPGMSEDAIAAAIFGSAKGQLDAAVAAGQITRAQAATVVRTERMLIEVTVAPTRSRGL